MDLTRDERVLVHQVHPAKLGVDIGTSLISSVLLWRGAILAGLAVRYAGPIAATLLVLRFGDLEELAKRAPAKYALKHMPPHMVAIRLVGDTLMAMGAWKHRPTWLATGAALVILGWSDGLRPSL